LGRGFFLFFIFVEIKKKSTEIGNEENHTWDFDLIEAHSNVSRQQHQTITPNKSTVDSLYMRRSHDVKSLFFFGKLLSKQLLSLFFFVK